jgi:CheY-like chemotaxis protein
VERGADLTKQLLGFARRGKYEVKPLHLTHIIEKMTSMFGHTHRNIAIDLDMAADLAAVLMDQSQLEQVLLNLFINADQAMSDGGRLHLRAENTVLSAKQAEPHGISAGRFVKLIVSDTGIGMDVVTKERIFEPFFTTKGPGLGTGLGLASVYGIIKSHGGVITVDSELGRGAAFTLFLPSTDRPFEKETKKRPSIQPGRGTILIVDDEEIIVKVYSALLTKIGYNVLSASGGKQAVEIARRLGHEISLVILDLVMPDMNGKETFHALKEIAPHIKVLLSSGYSIEGQAQELLSKGCDGFIQKPCSLAVLSAKLKEIL